MTTILNNGDWVNLKSSENRMIIHRIISDNAICCWHEDGQTKLFTDTFKLVDLSLHNPIDSPGKY